MNRVLKTPAAEIDLCEAWMHVADSDPDSADSFLDLVGTKCKLLAQFPELGEQHREVGMRVRFFPVVNHVIVYRPISDGIEVIRVLHGSRDFDSLF